MTLMQLRIFYELACSGSMGLCAKNLGVTKPNVSIAIANLEEELGVQLFFKTHAGSFLTPAGKQLYPYAKRICDDCDTIQTYRKREASTKDVVNILYQDVQGSFIQKFLDILEEKLDPCSIRTTNAPVPHTYRLENAPSFDIINGSLLENDISQLDDFRDEYFIYKTFESPLDLAIETRFLPSGITSDVSIKDLKKFKIVLTSNPPVSGETPSHIYKGYIARHNLADKLDVTICNSFSMTIHYIVRGFAAAYDEHEILRLKEEYFPTTEFSILRIKPEEIMMHYIMIKRRSQFFSKINEAMAEMFNSTPEEFKHMESLNYPVGHVRSFFF